MPPKRQNLTDPSTILRQIYGCVSGVLAETEATLAAAAEFERQAAIEKEKARQEFEANEPLTSWKRKRGFEYSWIPPRNPLGHIHQLSADLEHFRQGWCQYDLEFLTGDDNLTESHRQNWRREIRQMEADGLLERHGRLIRLTEAGWSAAEQLAESGAVECSRQSS